VGTGVKELLPRLTPWAVICRRFAAENKDLVPP
jgi:hypothetical protein